MIDKYFNGLIEQVCGRVGKTNRNIVMASYSNDFSIRTLESIVKHSEDEENVFFSWCEFDSDRLTGAYEPFLDVICDAYRKNGTGDFADFMRSCGVYELQQGTLNSYYETGRCVREENVLLDEVEYEQERMTEAISSMLRAIAEIRPIVVVINRFQLASGSTMKLVNQLLEDPSMNIGLVLGTNESHFRQESMTVLWEEIKEHIEDNSQMYHFGSTGIRRAEDEESKSEDMDFSQSLDEIYNMGQLLDFDQAKRYCQEIEHRIKFEDAVIDRDTKLAIYLEYARISILLGELSKALELVESIRNADNVKMDGGLSFTCAYMIATCYMYQGKLEKALNYAKTAKEEGERLGDDLAVFKAELLAVQARMSGWYNIFFCVQDIPVEESLIERLMKYNYKNHLAHIYIYAYDNRPEMIAKAYRSEAALIYFSKGIALAKEIGNAHLVHNAYEKNIMLASTNGMNEIAMLYSVRTYQFMKDKSSLFGGRIFCGIGYNLSALGYNEESEKFYDASIAIFYKLRKPEDIAEVYYNRALNNIMMERYEDAEGDMLLAVKAVERLHLNSLRVCNLSKMYALLALIYVLQGDQFNCERYLLSCRQFLNYIISREGVTDQEVIHDYAILDDDMFLYSFASALHCRVEGDNEGAFSNFEKAEKYLVNAEGNQFYSYRLYRLKRMELFQEIGRTELYERERLTLKQHDEMSEQISSCMSIDMLEEIHIEEYITGERVTVSQIEALYKQEGLAIDYKNVREQMEFISSWQKMIDTNDSDIEHMVRNTMHVFLNHFGTDRALYIWYEHGQARVFYNDTDLELTEENIRKLEAIMREYPQGFAVSKISDDFFDHQDAIEFFNVDDVVSFVAVPFFKNGKMTSLMITYVRMRLNWHSSLDRFMLDESDLKMYQLLFREVSYSIKRMEAAHAVHEMNRQLQAVAVTDLLTGIYNRTGMYDWIHNKIEQWKGEKGCHGLGLMFVDLDNFKNYNDSFGHDVGDLILKEMAKIFTDVAGKNGIVCRYGGDEFIILVNVDDKDVMESYAKEIYARIDATDGFRESIEAYIGRTLSVEKERRITCSIGISMNSDVKSEEEVDQMIKVADDLLYSVKTTEKGRYAFI